MWFDSVLGSRAGIVVILVLRRSRSWREYERAVCSCSPFPGRERAGADHHHPGDPADGRVDLRTVVLDVPPQT